MRRKPEETTPYVRTTLDARPPVFADVVIGYMQEFVSITVDGPTMTVRTDGDDGEALTWPEFYAAIKRVTRSKPKQAQLTLDVDTTPGRNNKPGENHWPLKGSKVRVKTKVKR